MCPLRDNPRIISRAPGGSGAYRTRDWKVLCDTVDVEKVSGIVPADQ